MAIHVGRILFGTGLALACLVVHAGCAAPARPARTVPRPPAADEQLAPAAATPAAAPQAPVALTILAVSAQPAQLPRGGETDMVVNYTVGGSSAVRVAERRELVKDGVTIMQTSDTQDRVPGAHTSARPVRVPADAAPGIYTLRVVLSAGGVETVGTAIFEVR